MYDVVVVGLTLMVGPLGKFPAGIEVQIKLPGLPLMGVAISVTPWPLQVVVSGPAFTAHCDKAMLLNARLNAKSDKAVILLVCLLFTTISISLLYVVTEMRCVGLF